MAQTSLGIVNITGTLNYFKLQILNFKPHLATRTIDHDTFDYHTYLKRTEKVSAEDLTRGTRIKNYL